jgi:YfiH family protein
VGTSIEKADGLFSARSDLALAIMVADCVPILLVDPDSADFAIVHAGWRGLKGEVLSNALERFTEPSSVRALLGPSISARRYQVGPEVAEYFRDLPGAVHADQGDRSLLDLRTVAALLLVGLGLRDEHVSVCEESTDETTTFYSARAQQPCGRFALVARRSS